MAASEQERDEWGKAIRNAKASLLVSLNVTQPNSTLTSSASTNHLRRALQALPHPPEQDSRLPRRGKVEHFVPAIWIPDGKTESCMRCGRTFGWRRRRHHCRLCGRCVCAACSGSVSACRASDSSYLMHTDLRRSLYPTQMPRIRINLPAHAMPVTILFFLSSIARLPLLLRPHIPFQVSHLGNRCRRSLCPIVPRVQHLHLWPSTSVAPNGHWHESMMYRRARAPRHPSSTISLGQTPASATVLRAR